MSGNGFIPPINMVMTRGWFMALAYPWFYHALPSRLGIFLMRPKLVIIRSLAGWDIRPNELAVFTRGSDASKSTHFATQKESHNKNSQQYSRSLGLQ